MLIRLRTAKPKSREIRPTIDGWGRENRMWGLVTPGHLASTRECKGGTQGTNTAQSDGMDYRAGSVTRVGRGGTRWRGHTDMHGCHCNMKIVATPNGGYYWTVCLPPPPSPLFSSLSLPVCRSLDSVAHGNGAVTKTHTILFVLPQRTG